jgi:beta-N-acetylhexosaminidase
VVRQYQVMRLFAMTCGLVLVAATACTSSTSGVPASSGSGPTASSPASSPGPSTPAGSASHSTTSSGRPSKSSPPNPPPTSPTSSPTTSTPSGTAPAGTAARVLAGMSLAERIGQLMMVHCPSTGVATSTAEEVRRFHVGSVILDGNSNLSIGEMAAVTARLQRLAAPAAGLFIATDQEGGLVQRLRGPGFEAIPSAVQQGRLAVPTVLNDWVRWGRQLARAGVNVNLGPVLDTVPRNSPGNPPIGDLDREYGHTPAVVSVYGAAVAQGLADARVDATVKHFPGLGRVRQNTDTTSGVVDSITTRHDAYLRPFRTAIGQGVPFVMMSTAIYSRIDVNLPAAFSPTIVTGMLRGDLGFRGVVISDDLGQAAQVSGFTPGQRAVNFVAAGGDIVLTVSPATVAPMVAALRHRARSDPGFRRLVDAAALTVLRAKQARGLLP